MVAEEWVTKIKSAQLESQRAVQRRDQIVRKAKDRGATWTQIGYALGITAQGAQKRYGSHEERVAAEAGRAARRAEKRAKKRESP